MRGFRKQRAVQVRVNSLRAEPMALIRYCQRRGLSYRRMSFDPLAFVVEGVRERDLLSEPEWEQGLFYLQTLSSQLPVRVLSPRRGSRILDMCAAPGSKSTQIAALVENEAQLVVCDRDPIRAQQLAHTLRLLGASAELRQCDAAMLKSEYSEYFDYVLADVPCSGEGRISLHLPQSYRRWTATDGVRWAKEQRRLLRAGLTMLRPGGLLVYSTCTLSPLENELLVASVLADESFSVEQERVQVEGFFATHQHDSGCVSVLPSEQSEGFFVARLRRL
jgi:16S rRNA (cytosine1407-C5)-methyltransferase